MDKNKKMYLHYLLMNRSLISEDLDKFLLCEINFEELNNNLDHTKVKSFKNFIKSIKISKIVN